MNQKAIEQEKALFVEIRAMAYEMRKQSEKMIDDIKALGLGKSGDDIIARLKETLDACNEEAIMKSVIEKFPGSVIKKDIGIDVYDINQMQETPAILTGRCDVFGETIGLKCDMSKNYLVETSEKFQEVLRLHADTPVKRDDLINMVNSGAQKCFVSFVRRNPEIYEAFEKSQIMPEQKKYASVMIGGEKMDLIDEWEADGHRFVLGSNDTAREFFAAEVDGRTLLQFDEKPDRTAVESDYFDMISLEDLDRHEAAYGADGVFAVGGRDERLQMQEDLSKEEALLSGDKELFMEAVDPTEGIEYDDEPEPDENYYKPVSEPTSTEISKEVMDLNMKENRDAR